MIIRYIYRNSLMKIMDSFLSNEPVFPYRIESGIFVISAFDRTSFYSEFDRYLEFWDFTPRGGFTPRGRCAANLWKSVADRQ